MSSKESLANESSMVEARKVKQTKEDFKQRDKHVELPGDRRGGIW